MDWAHDAAGELDRGSSVEEARNVAAATMVEIQAIATNNIEDILRRGQSSSEHVGTIGDGQMEASVNVAEEVEGSNKAEGIETCHAAPRNNLAMMMHKEFVRRHVQDDESASDS